MSGMSNSRCRGVSAPRAGSFLPGAVAWGWIFPTLLKFPPPLELGMGLGQVGACPTGNLQGQILRWRSQRSKGEVLIITSGFLGETTPKEAKPD